MTAFGMARLEGPRAHERLCRLLCDAISVDAPGGDGQSLGTAAAGEQVLTAVLVHRGRRAVWHRVRAVLRVESVRRGIKVLRLDS